MSEPDLIDKVLNQKKEEILKEVKERIETEAKVGMQRVETFFEQLKEASKVALPINVLEVFAKGGHVDSVEFRVNYPTKVQYELNVGGYNVFRYRDGYYREIDVNLVPGRYRATIIIERLGD